MSERENLAPLLEELADTLARLRDETAGGRQPGFRDLLRFTERYTIPAVVAVLETNIRLLELTAGAIRLADGRLEDRRVEDDATAGHRQVSTEALEAALDDLGEALRGTPADPAARDILAEARDLRREIRGRLTEADADPTDESTDEADPENGTDRTGAGGRSGHRVPVQEETEGPENRVDVDAELETIRRQLDVDEEADADGDPTTDGPAGEN